MDFDNTDNKKRIDKSEDGELIKKIYEIIKFAEVNEWYDSEFIKKSYELIEKGYTLNGYQILRIENGYDMIQVINGTQEEMESSNED